MLAAYDAIAEWYDRSVREGSLLSGDDLIAASGLDTLGTLEGRTLCDLACGQGHLARQFAKAGAKVLGVDISLRLLEVARREEEANLQGIQYVHADAQALPPLPGEPFDYVFCNMALMDIPDLDATLNNVARILRMGGSFVATITHPCFNLPQGGGYFDEGFWRSDNPNGVRGQVGANHRTLGTYITAFGNAGLLLDRATEPQLPNRNVPPVLVMRCRRV